MDLTTQPNPQQETIAAISQISRDKSDDFVVRITRRRSSGDLATPVATLADARLEHFLVGPKTPELWLPKLAGGGVNYLLSVFHRDNGEKPIGGPLIITVPGTPRDADPSALEDPEWVGPGRCIVPEKKPKQNEAWMNGPSPSSRQSPRPPVGEEGGGSSSPAVSTSAYAVALHNAEMSKQWEEINRAKETLAEERRRIEVAAVKRDADAQIAVARAEAETARREARERQDRIERELAEIRNRPPTAPPTAAPGQDRFAEVLLEMKKSDQEQRRAEREFQAEQRRAEREFALEREKIQAEAKAAADRAHAEMTAANNALQSKLLEVATTKPSGSDMAEKVLLSVTGAISNLMSNQVNMINSMSELGFGGRDEEPEEKEPAWMKSVERMARLFAPKPAPLPPPDAGQEQGQEQQALPSAPPAPVEQQQSTVVQIQRAVWSKANKPSAVADFILQRLGDPEVADLLVSEDKISDVLVKLLSKEWLAVAENRTYAKAVATAFMERGVQAKVFTEEALAQARPDIEHLGE
jgi:hypothetical protein